jgi:hypothetical protein
MITEVLDKEGNLQTAPPAIVRIFKDYMTTKYTAINIDDCHVTRLVRSERKTLTPAANTAVEIPITMEELHAAVVQ